MGRSVFASDIRTGHGHPSWELFSALEVGIDRTDPSSSKLQVVYRNLDGVSWDISQSVTSPNLPADDRTAFDIVKPFTANTDPKIGFAIHIKLLETGGQFSGTFSSTADAVVPWRGMCLGITDVPLSRIEAHPQPMDPRVKTFLEITPLGYDEDGGFVDMAQAGSNELFRDFLFHAMPKESARWFAKGLGSLGSSLKDKLCLFLDPLDLKIPVYFSIQKVFNDNRRFLELASMHYLCHNLKHAHWLTSEYKDAIIDKFDIFWDMLKCDDGELDGRRSKYGSNLPAAREADSLRSQYANATVRCYDIAFLWFARRQWRDAEKNDPAHLYDLVKATLTSDDYKDHWLPRTINISDRRGFMTVEQRLGMLSDKLRLLQVAGNRDDPADVKAIVDQLAHAAALSGIARRTLIDSPHTDIAVSPGFTANLSDGLSLRMVRGFDLMAEENPGTKLALQDYECDIVHTCLTHDAKDLGLYDWHFSWSSSGCLVL